MFCHVQELLMRQMLVFYWWQKFYRCMKVLQRSLKKDTLSLCSAGKCAGEGEEISFPSEIQIQYFNITQKKYVTWLYLP